MKPLTFKCQKCKQRKLQEGRKKYKVVKHDINGKPVYNWMCADCAKENI